MDARRHHRRLDEGQHAVRHGLQAVRLMTLLVVGRRWRGGWQGSSTTNLLPRGLIVLPISVISIELKGFFSRLAERQDKQIGFNRIPSDMLRGRGRPSGRAFRCASRRPCSPRDGSDASPGPAGGQGILMDLCHARPGSVRGDYGWARRGVGSIPSGW